MECHALSAVGVADQASLLSPPVELVEAYRSRVRRGRQVAAVGAERDGTHEPRPGNDRQSTAVASVPDAGHMVSARGRDERAVRAERDPGDRFFVSTKSQQFFLRGQVPKHE